MDRRMFLKRSALVGGGLTFTSPFHALGLRAAQGHARARVTGYGPLVPKGDLLLPVGFNYQVISRQGDTMSDGQPTPGIFDGMGALRGPRGTTILIRNHENRELAGETKVVTGRREYDPTMFGGDTKLEVRRSRAGRDPITGRQLYRYTLVRDFAILGGTSTNCAGGVIGGSWVTCEEVVKRGAGGQKHGYAFEIPADARGPVQAVPIPAFGRFSHEALCVSDGIVYLTEDRRIQPDPRLGFIAGCFYRFIPRNFRFDDDDDHEGRDDDGRGGRPSLRLAGIKGRLQALKISNEPHANMEAGRVVGMPYPVEWVDVPEPDHDDDTDNRTDRVRGFTPTRIQAQDRDAAYFEKMEGIWADSSGADDDDHDGDDNHDGDDDDRHGRGRRGRGGKVFFVTSDGGPINRGAVWEYDPARKTLTMIYESTDPARLDHPDNVVIVPQTGDILLCEDGDDNVQFLRGVTRDGEIYDFCQTLANDTEFAGACFDPDGHTLYVNQQGERGGLPNGSPRLSAVTYAIYGPFQKREGGRHDR